MDIAIVGGTGTVGAEAARELRVRGHDVRVLSRQAPEYQEAEIARTGVPWTIVRATQFHTLVARTFAAGARLGVVPSARVPLQPVDPREVGRVLAEAEPSLAITQFAGPEVVNVCELARFDSWPAS